MNLKENYFLSSQVKFFNTPSPDWFRGPWYHGTRIPGEVQFIMRCKKEKCVYTVQFQYKRNWRCRL